MNPTPAADSIRYRRMRAPAKHGEFFRLWPGPASLQERPHFPTAGDGPKIANRSWSELIADARVQLADCLTEHLPNLKLEPSRPIIMTGHQPELYHPGVWVKNFVLDRLAREWQATPVNFIVDNDVPKNFGAAILSGSSESPHRTTLLYDNQVPQVAWEAHPIQDMNSLSDFGQRMTSTFAPFVSRPLIQTWWPAVVAQAKSTERIGLAIANARQQLEQDWGLDTLQIPLSKLVATDGFRSVALHLLADIERFHSIFHQGLTDYRAIHRLRSNTHPFPNLLRESDGWWEAPFWLWTAQSPTRQPCFVRHVAGTAGAGIELRSGDQTLMLPGDLPEQVAKLRENADWKLRPRALMTTLYTRLFLSDAFIHGIGGAKYDQVTDYVIRHFFAVQPPPYLTVTATIKLPIASTQDYAELVRRAARDIRDTHFNPQKFLDHERAAQSSIAQKWASIADTGDRLKRHQQIVTANQQMQQWVAPIRAEREQSRQQAKLDQRRQDLLGSREFPFCVFAADWLREQMFAVTDRIIRFMTQLDSADSNARSRLGWGLVAFIGVLIWLLALSFPPAIATDLATCLHSAAQYEQGLVPSFHQIRLPETTQLDRDQLTTITWWPASYAGVPFAWRQLGLSWGASVTATFLSFWCLGVIGWCSYFCCELPKPLRPWFCLMFLLWRYSHADARVYTAGEFMFWSVFPWALLANLRLLDDRRPTWQAIVAAMLTLLLLLTKYSGALAVVSFATALYWAAWRGWASWRLVVTWTLAAFAVGLSLLFFGWIGSSNPATVRDDPSLFPWLWATGIWWFACTDLEILFMRLGVHGWQWLPAFGRYQDGHLTLFVPLAMWAFATWHWTRPDVRRSDADTLAAPVEKPTGSKTWEFACVQLVVSSLLLAGLISAGGKIHMDGRFLRPAAMALLPHLFVAIWGGLRAANWQHRWLSWLQFVTLFGVATAYGTVVLVANLIIRGPASEPQRGSDGIRYETVAENETASQVLSETQELLAPLPAETVVYLVDPAMAISLADRRVVLEHALLRTANELAGRQYRGSVPVALLLPTRPLGPQRYQAIKASFRDIRRWQPQQLGDSENWQLLLGFPE